MPSVGLLSHRLHSSGGQELCELAIARGLSARSWTIVNVHEESGDLASDWETIGTTHRVSRLVEPRAAETTTSLFAGVEIMYVHSTALLSHALRVGRALDVPVVSHLHLPPYHVRHGLGRWLRGHHLDDADPLVFTKATMIDRFLAVSHHTSQLWIESGIPAARIAVVPNGIDTDLFRPPTAGEKATVRESLGLPHDALLFIFVGRIDRAKGIEQLLAAGKAMRRRTGRTCAVVVVGEPSHSDGRQGHEYQQRLQRESPDTIWLGKRRDVERILRAADVAVIPSQWDEPFGLVAVEAMASGLPVIATARGGLTEILRGRLSRGLVGSSVRALADKMSEFAADDGLRDVLGVESRGVAVARFAQSKMIDEVDQHLHALVGSRSGR